MKPKTLILCLALGAFAVPLLCQCGKTEKEDTSPAPGAPAGAGQSAVQDDVSLPDIVKISVNSPDHTTLVAAVQAAKLVDALTNAGPFTVFAPTNAAFDKLPPGTVDNLLKASNGIVHVIDGVLLPE